MGVKRLNITLDEELAKEEKFYCGGIW